MNDRTVRCTKCHRDKYRDPAWKSYMKARCAPCFRELRRGIWHRTRERERVEDAPSPTIMRATGFNGPPCVLCRTPLNGIYCIGCGVENRGAA